MKRVYFPTKGRRVLTFQVFGGNILRGIGNCLVFKNFLSTEKNNFRRGIFEMDIVGADTAAVGRFYTIIKHIEVLIAYPFVFGNADIIW